MNVAQKIAQSIDNVLLNIRSLQQRADAADASTADRRRYADAVEQINYLKLKRDIRDMRRADQIEQEQDRERALHNIDLCSKHQRNYDDLFALHGRRAQEPDANADPYSYRRDLFRTAQRYLPSDHALAGFDPADIDGHTMPVMEKQLFDALREQADRPTGDARPDSADHPRAKRIVTDPLSGARTVSYHARTSFIKDMGRRGSIVSRLGPQSAGRGIVFPAIEFVSARR
jgi:hypothetical protein